MNVFIRATARTFSFGERLIVPFNGTINLSPHENILTIALINIHYLYIIFFDIVGWYWFFLQSRKIISYMINYEFVALLSILDKYKFF